MVLRGSIGKESAWMGDVKDHECVMKMSQTDKPNWVQMGGNSVQWARLAVVSVRKYG